MTDEADSKKTDAPTGPTSGFPAVGRPAAGEYFARSIGEKLFPGPSESMSKERAEFIARLLQQGGDRAAAQGRPGRPVRPGQRGADASSSAGRAPSQAEGSSTDESRAERTVADTAVTDTAVTDTAVTDNAVVDSTVADNTVSEKIDEQNELLRAILASSVDTQADARATAQNSRTFAWAGTAIAFLTLIATVVLIANGG